MKKPMLFTQTVMSLLLALLFLTSSAYAQNLLENNNPGFEAPYISGQAQGWFYNKWGSPAPTYNYNLETNNVHGGTYAQRLSLLTEPTTGGFLFTQKGKRVPIIPGHTYEASIWVRSDDSIKVQLNLRRPDNHYQSGAVTTVTARKDWHQITVRGGFDGGDSAQFCVVLKSKGTVYIDDASVVDITTQITAKPVVFTNTIPAHYFGLHVNKLGYEGFAYWPTINQGMIRLWDTGTYWGAIHKKKGATDDCFDFKRLDNYIKGYAQKDDRATPVIYTMGITPFWAATNPQDSSAYAHGSKSAPKDMQDWRDYVRAVGRRYSGPNSRTNGRIRYWEIWNEFNLNESKNADGSTKRHFWSGNVKQMYEMTKIAYEELKAIDPTNMILSPNVAIGGMSLLDDFLTLGGGKYIDIISWHKYQGLNPEYAVPLIEGFRSLAENHGIGNKPQWNTEGAVEFRTTPSADQVLGAVARPFLVQWAYGVGNFNWYTWERCDAQKICFSTKDDKWSTPLPGAIAYQQVAKWLTGAQMVSKSINGTTWTLEIKRGLTRGWIVWNTTGSKPFTIPSAWGVTQKRDLKGDTTNVSSSVTIGYVPILLENLNYNRGLTAQYFDNKDLTSPKGTRIDPLVNYNWGYGTPTGAGLTSPETFSVRWTGFVQPKYTQTYTFSTLSDDGVRVWVNNRLVIDNWTDHTPTTNTSAGIPLVAGQKYAIKVEYFDNLKGAQISLSWQSPSQKLEVIPESQLYPAATTAREDQQHVVETSAVIATPNPFKTTTTIRYSLPAEAPVELTVYDLFGKQVALLNHNIQKAGTYESVLEGDKLPSGVYIYKLKVGSSLQTGRLLLIK